MNYDFTETETAFFSEIAETAKAFAESTDLERRDPPANEENIRRLLGHLARTPYLQMGIAPVAEFSGQLSLMGAMEVLAAISPSAYLAVEASTRLFCRALAKWGSSDQKAQWLEPFLEGRHIGALALSEAGPEGGMECPATSGEIREGTVTINGSKQYVINAPIADWIAAAGVCGDKQALFLIERTAPGLTMDPPLATLGYEGAPVCALHLQNCRIPREQVLFSDEDGDMAAAIRLWENQILLGASLGLCKSAFETARKHAKEHKSGGKPIIAYQQIGFKLADMLTRYQTSQFLAWRTAWTMDTAPADAEELMFCAKVFCTEAAEQICSQAMQILGGAGYICGNKVERAYRCAKYGQIAGTSTERARVHIGDAALGYRN